jgi:hypothetical protein
MQSIPNVEWNVRKGTAEFIEQSTWSKAGPDNQSKEVLT